MTEILKELMPAGDIRYVGPDHALDCLRYIVMSRPRAPKPHEEPKAMTTQEAFFHRSHQRWARAFRDKVHGSFSWF